jgi:hypothetical protein
VLNNEHRETERSWESIDDADPERLGRLARTGRETFFTRNPRWRDYAGRVMCVALCQGAALHFVNGKNGVKDFDVWTFFSEHPGGRLRAERRTTQADFGPSKFGHRPADPPGYTGRRVDFLMRSIKCSSDTEPADAIRQYLTAADTDSARELAKKAVVFIEPEHLRGQVVWPV